MRLRHASRIRFRASAHSIAESLGRGLVRPRPRNSAMEKSAEDRRSENECMRHGEAAQFGAPRPSQMKRLGWPREISEVSPWMVTFSREATSILMLVAAREAAVAEVTCCRWLLRRNVKQCDVESTKQCDDPASGSVWTGAFYRDQRGNQKADALARCNRVRLTVLFFQSWSAQPGICDKRDTPGPARQHANERLEQSPGICSLRDGTLRDPPGKGYTAAGGSGARHRWSCANTNLARSS